MERFCIGIVEGTYGWDGRCVPVDILEDSSRLNIRVLSDYYSANERLTRFNFHDGIVVKTDDRFEIRNGRGLTDLLIASHEKDPCVEIELINSDCPESYGLKGYLVLKKSIL